MRSIFALSLVSLFSGCVIYEEELVEDTGEEQPSERPDTEEPELAFDLWLNPAGAVVGQTTIVSLFAEGDVDLGGIDSIRFFGDGGLEVLATDARSPHEFLLTISVPQSATLGGNDLLVEFEDGTAAFVEAAFTVVSDPSQIPPSSGGPDEACP
jgi:hypothetical protein